MTTRAEQHTTTDYSPGSDVVRIRSNYPPHVRRMRADAAYRELPDSQGWAAFEIDADRFNVLGRRRDLKPEERAARAERIRANGAEYNATRAADAIQRREAISKRARPISEYFEREDPKQ
jgi:hypothetical protein